MHVRCKGINIFGLVITTKKSMENPTYIDISIEELDELIEECKKLKEEKLKEQEHKNEGQ